MSKIAVITGASAGVGRACARAFAEKGYDVGLLARGTEGLEGAVREAEKAGVRAIAVEVDVADAPAVERAADRVESELGPIEVWVNNAMASVFAPFMELTPEEFERVISVTFLGQANGTRAALRRMTQRDRGTIVQVGSALAYRGIPLQSAYCAAKHAVQGFCDSLRAELIHDGSSVHVSMVQLPALNTPQFDIQRNKMRHKAQPVPPIFQPEVAAKAIVFAAEHRRREIWVGWPTVRAILGNRLMPKVLDRFLGMTGFDSQLRDEPKDADSPDVLFTPAHEDFGAHGSFEQKAIPRSRHLDVNLSEPVTRIREFASRKLEKRLARGVKKIA
jgi:short-subunit dehydrogenase